MTDPYAALRQCVEALELHNEYPGSIWPFQVKATRNAAITAARAALERQQLSYEREREIDQDEIERLLALRRDDARVLERLRAENAALKRDLQYARDGLTKGRTRMREDNERLREVVQRLVVGIDHLSEIARQWEPDHSSGADRRRWLLANDARDDAIRLLGPNASMSGPQRPAQEVEDGTE